MRVRNGGSGGGGGGGGEGNGAWMRHLGKGTNAPEWPTEGGHSAAQLSIRNATFRQRIALTVISWCRMRR